MRIYTRSNRGCLEPGETAGWNSVLCRSVWLTGLMALAILLGACRRRQSGQGVEQSPIIDVNAPRPTNEVAGRFPWVTNPPSR